MNKKTVSILLIIFVSIAIALFSFTSCKNEPKLEPTAAPKPGYVPEIPNNVTPLSKIEKSDLEASINTLAEGLSGFFANYTSTYETPIKGLRSGDQSLSGPISISAPNGEDSFRGKAFTYSDIKGELAFRKETNVPGNTEESFFLIIEGVVTSEVFGDTKPHAIKMKYNMRDESDYFFYVDDVADTAAPKFSGKRNISTKKTDYYHFPNGTKTLLSDATELAAVKAKADLLMFIGYKALAESTINVEDMQVVMKVDKDNILSAGITGQIQLSGEPLKERDDDNIDFYDDPVEDLFNSFTATVSDLTVAATLSTKAGNETDGYTSETLSATLSLSNLSLGTIYGNLSNTSEDDDEDLTTVSFEKLALSAWNSDDSVILSLEISDFDLSAEMSLSPRINLSMTLGLGIKADDNSVGLVADFELNSGKMTGVPFINFTSKAAVINGSYYQTEVITESLYDYFDLALSTIVKNMRSYD